MKKISFLFLLISFSVFSQIPGEAEFQKAQAAFNDRDYQVWFDESLKAAEKGHPEGLLYVAYAYDPFYAKNYPVPAQKDDKKAFEYYKKSGDKGSGYGAFTTGELYRLGEGTTKDDKMALDYYKKAYELGYTEAGPTIYQMLGANASNYIAYLESCVQKKLFHAAEDLGFIYIKDEIITSDIPTAMKWLEIGDKNNHAGCIYIIAYLYRNGFKKGTDGKVTLNDKDANIPKAIEFYTKAANLGNVPSMNNLAEMYLQGLETKQDSAKAFEWFEKACNVNNGYACYMCSMMIVNQYITKPQEDAAKFSERALKLGYMPGKK
jgi:uncharacterized protein